MVGFEQLIGRLSPPSLIFVISFTQAVFSNLKFYTQKLAKNSKHSKMSLKSEIYADFVFNLENSTSDRIFYTGTAHGARDIYQVCLPVHITAVHTGTFENAQRPNRGRLTAAHEPFA